MIFAATKAKRNRHWRSVHMELRYLEIFVRVVEKKSFSLAAEDIGLTQPTVSIHIKSLED